MTPKKGAGRRHHRAQRGNPCGVNGVRRTGAPRTGATQEGMGRTAADRRRRTDTVTLPLTRLDLGWTGACASRNYTSPHPCDDAAPRLSRAVRSIERVAKSFRPATSADHLPARTVDSSGTNLNRPKRQRLPGKQQAEQEQSSARQPRNRLQRPMLASPRSAST